MQTLKKEVKESILKAGIQEFYEKGFLGASMRNIAFRSNVSVGNVYRYFQNKERLFEEIARPFFQELKNLFDSPTESKFKSLSLQKALVILKEHFIPLIIQNRKLLIILYDRSEGTPYAEFKEIWTNLISKQFCHYISIYNQKFPNLPFDERIALPAATSFLEGIIQIARDYESPEDINNLTLEFIRLYFYWSITKEE
ncbi:TetR/AcrR family transcriptional regulator [Risungbinella massiliensis]|uniref:TetR/AcrR family transcriptional regulator n=1 Tax=Risungbinella massiliensis TaxID=1329796 RepID=UPI0005CBE031|nr:TetR/AcrR family transcriptional regulator [Risungbinella massiliensis]